MTIRQQPEAHKGSRLFNVTDISKIDSTTKT